MIPKTWLRSDVIIGLVGIFVAIPLGLFSGILTPSCQKYWSSSPQEANSAINQAKNTNSSIDVDNTNMQKPPGIKSSTPTPSSTFSEEPTSTPVVSPSRLSLTHTPTPMLPTPSPTPTLPVPSDKFEPISEENVQFDFLDCSLANGNVTCRFRITNKGVDRKVGFRRPLLMHGNNVVKPYECKTPQIANSSGDIELLTDKEVVGTMTFDGVSKDISSIDKLVVTFQVEGKRGHSRFKLFKIGLTRL